jgi:hypothetical protein
VWAELTAAEREPAAIGSGTRRSQRVAS